MNRLSNYHAHLTPPTAPKKGILVTAPGAYGGGNGPQSLPWGGVSSTGKPPTLSSGADPHFAGSGSATFLLKMYPDPTNSCSL